MTEQEKMYFEKLQAVKANLVKAHDDAKEPIEVWFADEQDLYSDTAHFVYELLQNADDAGSSQARFVLYGDRLVFAHSGANTKRFTISSFDTKEEDSGTERYGSVNALTDRNGTNKKDDNEKGNAIGKFGRGFKSVYGYTSTPSVYDENLRFRIERIIVPVDLSNEPDCPERQDGETLFVLPFNRNGMTSEQAVEQIQKKLKELVMPTLFLRNLKEISFDLPDGAQGYYKKTVKEGKDYDNGDEARLVEMSFQLNGAILKRAMLWIFSRKVKDNHKVSVGYFVNQQDGSLDSQPLQMPAFCYFPTRHETGLNFLIQAPFRLTATRERIKDELSEPHNGDMVRTLAQLAATSMEYLRDLKDKKQRSLLTDNIIDIIPTKYTTKQDYSDCLDLSPFAEKMSAAFRMERIIPTKSGGHVSRANAYWPDSQDVSEVFSEEQLQVLFVDPNARWVFPSRWSDPRHWGDSQRDEIWKLKFLRNLELKPGNAASLLQPNVLTSEFVIKQPLDWLLRFHKWIASNKEDRRRHLCKCLPIFVNQNRQPICPYDTNGNPQLFKPGSNGGLDIRADRTVLPEFLKSEASRNLLDFYQAHEPSRIDDIDMILDQEWDAESKADHLAAFKIVYEEIGNLNENERRTVIEKLKGKKFLAVDARGENPTRKLCNELYFLKAELKSYFSPPDVKFLDINAYEGEIGEEGRERIVDLMKALGVAELPRKISVTYQGREAFDEEYRGKNWSRARPNGVNEWKEDEFEGMLQLINMLDAKKLPNGKDVSLAVWTILTELVQRYGEGNFLSDGVHQYLQPYQKNPREEPAPNYLLHRLRSAKWLLGKDGTLVSARDGHIQSVDVFYAGNTPYEIALRNLIGLRDDDKTKALLVFKRFYPELADNVEDMIARGNGQAKKHEDEKKDVEREVRKHVSKLVNADQEDPYLDLVEEFEEDLKRAQKCEKAPPEVGDENVMKVLDFLAIRNLRIPDYQRPYKWTKRSVLELLSDIDKMVIEKCKEDNVEPSMRPYRVGTIVLNKKKDENDDQEYYDIVDGQQRTITFTLLALGMGLNLGHISNSKFYPALSQSLESQRNLHNNMVYICEYLKSRTDGNTDYLEMLKKVLAESLEVVVICVETQEEAFQLFDSQNTRGRPLAPHDLLKAYHLRLMKAPKGASKEEKKKFEEKETKQVSDWENLDSNVIGGLFQDILYPIYRWSRKEKSNAFSTKDIYVFKGVPLGYKDKYGYVDRVCVTGTHFQIGDDFTPGECFFEYVKHYLEWKREIKKLLARAEYASVKTVIESYNSPYARNLFYAVLMAYFDRFGFDIPTEDVRRTVVKLCLWAYSVCLDLAYFGAKTPNKYAIGLPDGNDRYSNQKAMFYLIRNAVFHTDVAKIAVEHSKREDEQFTGERVALQKALKELK